MISNTRAATTAAAKPLEFQVMSGSFALAGNQPANYTLVTGETEALLVDVPFSRSGATLPSTSWSVGRTEPITPSAVGARRPSTRGRSSIWMTVPL